MWKFRTFFINFSQKLQSLKSLAVKYYYFLTEFQNSMSSVFFCFGPGLVFYSRKHKPKYLTKKAKAKLRMKQEHFFCSLIFASMNPCMPTSLVSSLLQNCFLFLKKSSLFTSFSRALFCFALSCRYFVAFCYYPWTIPTGSVLWLYFCVYYFVKLSFAPLSKSGNILRPKILKIEAFD